MQFVELNLRVVVSLILLLMFIEVHIPASGNVLFFPLGMSSKVVISVMHIFP